MNAHVTNDDGFGAVLVGSGLSMLYAGSKIDGKQTNVRPWKIVRAFVRASAGKENMAWNART